MANTEKNLSNDHQENVSGGIIMNMNTNQFKLDDKERMYAEEKGLNLRQMKYAWKKNLPPYSTGKFNSAEEPADEVKNFKN